MLAYITFFSFFNQSMIIYTNLKDKIMTIVYSVEDYGYAYFPIKSTLFNDFLNRSFDGSFLINFVVQYLYILSI